MNKKPPKKAAATSGDVAADPLLELFLRGRLARKKASGSLTLGAYQLGVGTERQRQAFEREARKRDLLTLSIAQTHAHTMDAARALGLQFHPGESLNAAAGRAKGDVGAQAIVGLVTVIERLLNEVRRLQSEPVASGRAGGALGGRKTAAGNKKPNGLTITRDRRKKRFVELRDAELKRLNERQRYTLSAAQRAQLAEKLALEELAESEGVSANAIRQSLKAAGAPVTTKSPQSRAKPR